MGLKLSKEMREDLETIARKMGLTAADVVRMAIEDLIEQIDEKGELVVKFHGKDFKLKSSKKKTRIERRTASSGIIETQQQVAA